MVSRKSYSAFNIFKEAFQNSSAQKTRSTKRKQVCEFLECETSPRYNFPHQSKPRMYKEHKLQDMIPTKFRKKYGNPGQGIYLKNPHKQFSEGSNNADDCALNVLINGRRKMPGKCLFYMNKRPALEVSVQNFCAGCKRMMHPDCYWVFHNFHAGLCLDSLQFLN